MENIIEYYYNLKVENLLEKEEDYFFKSNSNSFILKKIENPSNIDKIYFLSQEININKIIPNNNQELITTINNKLYTLLLIKRISNYNLSLISKLSNTNIFPIKELERNNWELLWEERVDFLEEFLTNNTKKYPLLAKCSPYYIGLSENAIAYLINTKKEVPKDNYLDQKAISHISFNNSLYDPFNIIFDHKSRDLSEYIKLSFFRNNKNIYQELDNYFKYNKYSKYGIMVLYSRLLYPSFFFHTFDSIINNKEKESYLNNYINKIEDYEIYLYNIYLYLSKYYDIPIPNWLKKK